MAGWIGCGRWTVGGGFASRQPAETCRGVVWCGPARYSTRWHGKAHDGRDRAPFPFPSPSPSRGKRHTACACWMRERDVERRGCGSVRKRGQAWERDMGWAWEWIPTYNWHGDMGHGLMRTRTRITRAKCPLLAPRLPRWLARYLQLLAPAGYLQLTPLAPLSPLSLVWRTHARTYIRPHVRHGQWRGGGGVRGGRRRGRRDGC